MTHFLKEFRFSAVFCLAYGMKMPKFHKRNEIIQINIRDVSPLLFPGYAHEHRDKLEY